MTSAVARIIGPARSKFIPNTLRKLEFALQHLFQVAALLVLINALPGALPLSRLFPSTSSKMPSHQNCASILLFINRPHLASAVETQGDPDGIFPSEGSGL